MIKYLVNPREGSGLSQAFTVRCEGIVKEDVPVFLHRDVPDFINVGELLVIKQGIIPKTTESITV